MIEMLFWLFLGIVFYIYVGYPLLAILLGILFKREVSEDSEFRPSVTLIISAFNEEDTIADKLKNSIELDYPKELFRIIVVSDASDDRTDGLVREFGVREVELFRLEERKGKSYGITQAMRSITSDIVVFSDANAMYNRDAILELVKYFADPEIGYVVGNAQYYKNIQSKAGLQEQRYWSFELLLKNYESMFGSVVGGDGAIYAIRHKLFISLEEDDINDFVNPLQIILMGYRGVFNHKAICHEHTATSFEKEFNRKRRIVNRSWRGLLKNSYVLNPLNSGLHAWQIISHKLLRWLGGVFIIMLFVMNLFLLNEGWFYMVTFSIQIMLFLSFVVGMMGVAFNIKTPSILLASYYFIRVNVSSALGIIDNYLGRKYEIWATDRD